MARPNGKQRARMVWKVKALPNNRGFQVSEFNETTGTWKVHRTDRVFQYSNQAWEYARKLETYRTPHTNPAGDHDSFFAVPGTNRPRGSGLTIFHRYSFDDAVKAALEGAYTMRKTYTVWGKHYVSPTGDVWEKLKTVTPAAAQKAHWGNPAPAAAALYESWTGEPSTHETVVVDTIHAHAHLTDLARLVAFKLRGVRGQLKFTDHSTRLCSNETGTQLYIRGGDQAINLDDFNTVSNRRIDPTKDSVVLGEIEYLYYSARKPFLGKEHTKTGVYKHKLGEETGNRPVLLYDTRSALLSISGGSYYIKPGDYDGKHSRGIVD